MKKYILINIAFLFVLSTNSQNVKTYNGPMTKPEWIAELFFCESGINGSYSYYEDEEENRILHGIFKVSYSTVGCVDATSLIEICGNYNHGKRNGHWTIKDKNLITGKENPYYYYDFIYKDGLLNGKFSFRDNGYGYEMTGKCVNGTLSDTVLFRKYYPFGSVSFKGKVNKEGLPHGIWVEKNEYKGAVPMETRRLYYNGYLVYRREKDLSSGKIKYTYQISNSISIPSDLDKIQDTTIDGVKYVDVGGIICGIDTNSGRSGRSNDFLLFNDIYPAIQNWNMEFDTNTYKNVLREKQREIERQEYEKKIKEEQQKREIMRAFEWGGIVKNMAYHCWGEDAFEEFEKLYKEGGEKMVEEEAEKIIRYEYENYTIGELAEKSKNKAIRSTINRKCDVETKKKPLTWLFSTYDRYLEYARCAKVYEAFLWL